MEQLKHKRTLVRFDTSSMGEERQHIFVRRNEGTARAGNRLGAKDQMIFYSKRDLRAYLRLWGEG